MGLDRSAVLCQRNSPRWFSSAKCDRRFCTPHHTHHHTPSHTITHHHTPSQTHGPARTSFLRARQCLHPPSPRRPPQLWNQPCQIA